MEIREFAVPKLKRYNGSSEAVLDCTFDCSEEELATEVVVMWYFGQDKAPFLQWIAAPGNMKPQLIDRRGRFRGRLEQGQDSATPPTHHALRLTNLDPSISGVYKCKVSTLYDEDFQQKEMIVYGEIDQTLFLGLRLEFHFSQAIYAIIGLSDEATNRHSFIDL